MKVEAYVASHSVGGKDDKLTASAIILVAIHDDGRAQVRRMTFALGGASLNVAGLKGARLAILAVRRHSDCEMSVMVDNRYIVEMLAMNGPSYRASPKVNVDEVGALRAAAEAAKRCSLVCHRTDGGIGAACLALARSAAASQSSFDEGTREVQGVKLEEELASWSVTPWGRQSAASKR